MSRIYINLPVKDLSKSITFYKALGFVQNLEFSDEKAAAMNWKDDFSVMLLSQDFFSRFVPVHKTIADSKSTTEVLNAVELDSRADVDTIFERAIATGGKKQLIPTIMDSCTDVTSKIQMDISGKHFGWM